MGIVWFLLGIVVGALIAWWLLSNRFKAQLEAKDAELGEARRQGRRELEEERSAHDETRRRLSDSQGKEASAVERVASLERDLTTVRGELNDANGRSAEVQAQLGRVEADRDQLESRLNDANRANAELSRQHEESQATRGREGDVHRSSIAELEGKLREQEREIARLEAALGAAQASPDNATPVALSERSGAASPPRPAEDTASSADDLTRIRGIGAVLQGKLNQLGIRTFRQIADFTPADIERINTVLDFPGRIEREQWVEQARGIVGRSS